MCTDVRRLCKALLTAVEKIVENKELFTWVITADEQKKEAGTVCEMYIYQPTPAPVAAYLALLCTL